MSYKKKLIETLFDRPLTTRDITNYASKLKINNFHRVFSSNNVPNKPYDIKCAIVNLNTLSGTESHWVAYQKQSHSYLL